MQTKSNGAEIIAIGTELLTPHKIDTNSLWLTERLNDLGIEVMLKTIVGDDVARLREVVGDALKRSSIVITTGGLGPTEDDITRTTIAHAVGRELVYHEDIAETLRQRFLSWGREMPEINKRQAYVVDGCEILPNPNGSAVGMLIDSDTYCLVVLPGPPRENKPMFIDHVEPHIRRSSSGNVTRRRLLKVSGLGESAVDERAAPIYGRYDSVTTSILFNKSEVEIHLAGHGRDAIEIDVLLDRIVGELSEAFGRSMFTTEGETMEEVVGRLLIDRGETVAFAESCTGGLIGERITNVPGSSAYFIESAVTYSNDAKRRVLGVSDEILIEFGAVSEQCAAAMASGIRERANVDHAVSITGIAGPDGGSDAKPVGTVFFGYSGKNGESVKRFVIPGDRELIRWRSSQAALDLLRRRLLE